MGLKGPYVLSFSQSAPGNTTHIDTSFFSKLGIPGFVPAAERGLVSGVAIGVPPKFEMVLHWHNQQNQYWTYAERDGSFKSPKMKPGSYTMMLYKQEFAVAQTSVKVTAGTNTVLNITSAEKISIPIWRVGEFDGQPFELKNGDKFLKM
jgi:rhamnogalacturonan endolyase